MSNRDPRKSVQTFSGKRVWPLDPRPEDFNLLDIAHHLAQLNRFNGAANRPHSVAMHTLNLIKVCPPALQDEAAFHDTPEFVIGDVVWPIKQLPELRIFNETEDKLFQCICEAFNLPFRELSKEFNIYDRMMGNAEVILLLPNPYFILLDEWKMDRAYVVECEKMSRHIEFSDDWRQIRDRLHNELMARAR